MSVTEERSITVYKLVNQLYSGICQITLISSKKQKNPQTTVELNIHKIGGVMFITNIGRVAEAHVHNERS